MTTTKTTYYSETDDLTDVFVGRRIISAETPVDKPYGISWDKPYGISWEGRGLDPYGLLTLDDGTKVYVVGNDGGCACSAGCYQLTKLASVDNIITAVRTVDQSKGDEGPWDVPGKWSIFVIAGADELNIAEFEGTDGNGYYGTGFRLSVIAAEVAK